MSDSTGRSTFIIVRPEIEDYESLFKIAEDAARVIDGTPIIDLHLTIQAIRNVEDFESLKKRLTDYCQTLSPFEISAKHIARMNVNNQQGRLWLLAEKSAMLKKIYTDIGQIAQDMGYDSYSYEAQNWLPHIKIVELSENRSTQIKDPTFGANNRICFPISHIEWTLQREPERWELLDKFPFHE